MGWGGSIYWSVEDFKSTQFGENQEFSIDYFKLKIP